MKLRSRNILTLLQDKTCDYEDRIALACLLFKAGYAVKIGSEQMQGKKQKIYFVEFWEE